MSATRPPRFCIHCGRPLAPGNPTCAHCAAEGARRRRRRQLGVGAVTAAGLLAAGVAAGVAVRGHGAAPRHAPTATTAPATLVAPTAPPTAPASTGAVAAPVPVTPEPLPSVRAGWIASPGGVVCFLADDGVLCGVPGAGVTRALEPPAGPTRDPVDMPSAPGTPAAIPASGVRSPAATLRCDLIASGGVRCRDLLRPARAFVVEP